jgi:hypothetical protein
VHILMTLKNLEGLLPTIVTAVSGLVVAILTYLLGRKSEVARARMEKGWPLAEIIAIRFIEVHGLESDLRRWFQGNFGHLTNSDEGADFFDEHRDSLYADDAARIESLNQKRRDLAEAIKQARIYLNPADLDRIEEYLSIGDFKWTTAPPFFTEYTRKFFKNLLDEGNKQRRDRLHAKIKRRLNKIHQQRWWS